MALAVALVWWQRAAITGSWWPLLLAGVAVGVGFQAKMLQAWLIVPALVVGTVVAASAGPAGHRGRRVLLHLAALLGATVVASLAWSVAIELLPASSRPYVDGSTDDDVFAMVFGYNGVDRFLPGAWPGAVRRPRTCGGAHRGARGAGLAERGRPDAAPTSSRSSSARGTRRRSAGRGGSSRRHRPRCGPLVAERRQCRRTRPVRWSGPLRSSRPDRSGGADRRRHPPHRGRVAGHRGRGAVGPAAPAHRLRGGRRRAARGARRLRLVGRRRTRRRRRPSAPARAVGSSSCRARGGPGSPGRARSRCSSGRWPSAPRWPH